MPFDYVPIGPTSATLTKDSGTGEFTLVDAAGQVFHFHGFDASLTMPAAKQGGLIDWLDAGGATTTSVSYNGDGSVDFAVRVMEMPDSSVYSERLGFEYIPFGTNRGKVLEVALTRWVDEGPEETVGSARYDYYSPWDAHGTAGSLRRAWIKDAAGATVETKYYRYYGFGDADGPAGLLKYVIEGESYDQLRKSLGGYYSDDTVLSASDEAVADFANKFFKYDSSRRVIEEQAQGAGCSVCAGGLGKFQYTYTTSAHGDGFNSWRTKTVETLPDLSTNTVYTNSYGQVMLKIHSGDGLSWGDYYRYDDAGRVLVHAAPSALVDLEALMAADDANADLVDFEADNAVYLSDTEGLFEEYTYGSTGSSMMATSGADGDVVGYLKSSALRHGELGAPVLQETWLYRAHSSDASVTVYNVVANTVYRDDGGSGALTTRFEYSYYSGTNAIESITATLPAVTTTQNGSNAAASMTTVFDFNNRPVWTRDAAGVIGHTEYDPATGAVVKVIADVDTAEDADFSDLPSGWETPLGAGQHLISTYEVDEKGRTTKAVDPLGRVTYTIYNDFAHEVRVYSGWTGSTTTGPITVYRDERALGYTETLTMAATPDVAEGRPTGGEAISNIQSLSRSYRNAAGQTVYVDEYYDLTGVTYSTAKHIGAEGTNYLRTGYSYGKLGQLNKTVAPAGTITRTEVDTLGRTVSVWVGTDDSPTSGNWSVDNLDGTDMVKVSEYEYDHGGVGDGNVTRTTLFPNGTTDPRVTESAYDWRNRVVATKSGVEAIESGRVNRPLTTYEYNNLNQVITTRTYDGDGLQVGLPSTSPLFAFLLGGSSIEGVYAISSQATDAAGNIFITGLLTGTMDFDPGAGTFILSSAAGANYIAAYTADGALIWAKQTAATVEAIATDDAGIYATGRFSGTKSIGGTSFAATGETDAYVWKLDSSDGSTEWIVQSGGAGAKAAGVGVAVDTEGNLYVSGGFGGDDVNFGGTSMTPVGDMDLFVWKMDSSDGSTDWVIRAGGPSVTIGGLIYSDHYNYVTVDREGGVYVAGVFYGGDLTIGGTTLSPVVTDSFILKLDPSDGSTDWLVHNGPTSTSWGGLEVRGLVADDRGGIFAIGSLLGTASFGGTTVTATGFAGVVWKVDASDGSNKWVTYADGAYLNNYGIAIDGAGDIYVTGGFVYEASFPGQELTSVGSSDAFVWKLNGLDGETERLQLVAGEPYPSWGVTGYGVAVNGGGDLFVVGTVGGTAVFSGILLTSTKFSDGYVWKAASALRSETVYSYDNLGRVYQIENYRVDQATGEVDGDPDTTKYWYDARGQLVKTEMPNGLSQKYQYDSLGQLVVSYATHAGDDEYYADVLTVTGDTVWSQSEYSYDAAGQLILSVQRDRVHEGSGTGALTGGNARTTYSASYYDLLGRTIADVDVGTNGGTPWTRPGSVPASSDTVHVTTYAYGDNGLLSGITDAEGVTSTWTYDLLGRTVSQTAASGTSVAFTTDYDYDGFGRLFSITAPGGRITEYGYDSWGRLNDVIERANTAFERVSRTVYDAIGQVVSVTEAFGTSFAVTTEYAYDVLGRTIATTEAVGTEVERTSSQIYDVFGRTLRSIDPNGNVTRYSYDDPNRRGVTTDALGNDWTNEYDNAGNLVASSDPLGNTTTWAYDLLGRVTARATPLNAQSPGSFVTQYRYLVNGIRDEVEDALHHITAVEYDPFGMVAESMNADNTATQFEYDRLGHRTSVTDPNSNKTTFEYDELYRVKLETDPNNKTKATTYNASGLVETVTDRLGRIQAFDYDVADRLTSVTWWNAAHTVIVDTLGYSYDLLDRMLSAANGAGGYTFTYDELGRVWTAEDPHGLTITYDYDNNGNVLSRTDSLWGTVISAYDALNHLILRTQTSSDADPLRVEFDYDARGLLAEARRYADATSSILVGRSLYTFDADGRQTGLTHLNGAASILVEYVNDFDEVGRILSETRNTVLKTFSYDAVGQITNDGSASYSYDDNGNRNMSGYATSIANRTTSDGVWNYGYDFEGNVISKERISDSRYWTFVYDHRNQMTHAEEYNHSSGSMMLVMDYDYDVFGNLIDRTLTPAVGPGTTTKLAYEITARRPGITNNANELWGELDNSASMSVRYFNGDQGEHLARSGPGIDTAYLLTDRLGSIREMTNTSGGLVKEVGYDGFGNIVSDSGIAAPGNVLFAGYWYDETVNQYVAHWRRLNPENGQWTAEDPLGIDAGDGNFRRYVRNNGLNIFDSSGLEVIHSSEKDKLSEYEKKHFLDQLISGFAATTKMYTDKLKIEEADLIQIDKDLGKVIGPNRKASLEQNKIITIKNIATLKANLQSAALATTAMGALKTLINNADIKLDVYYVTKDKTISEATQVATHFATNTKADEKLQYIKHVGIAFVHGDEDDTGFGKATLKIPENAKFSVLGCYGGRYNSEIPKANRLDNAVPAKGEINQDIAFKVLIAQSEEIIKMAKEASKNSSKLHLMLYFGIDNENSRPELLPESPRIGNW